jgi:hypothetical protein
VEVRLFDDEVTPLEEPNVPHPVVGFAQAAEAWVAHGHGSL